MYDTEIYVNPEKAVNVCGIISEIKQKEKTSEITLKRVDVIKGTVIKSSEELLIYLKTSDYLKIGQKVNIYGTSAPFKTAGNPGTFDASCYYHNKGYAYIVFADKINITDKSYNYFKEGLRIFSDYMCSIFENIFNEYDADIMSAIVLGRREKVKEEETYLYRQSGCMHLFAVSGLHVSMLMGIFMWIIQRIPVGFKSGRIALILMLIAYGILTGFSISCIRSVIMIIMTIIARLFGRRYDIPSAIAMAGIVILLINPKELFSAGFLLSFSAVAAITIVSPYLVKYTGAGKLKVFYPAFSVSVVTFPVILYYYNDAPVYSVFINIIVIPVMSLLFVMGILCLAAALIYMPVSGFFSASVHYILAFYEKLCRTCTDNIYNFRLKGHIEIRNIIICYLFFVLILIIIKINKREISNRIICMLSVISMFFILMYDPLPACLQITMLDVGQGDGIYIKTPDNRAIMIDGGSMDEDSLSRYTLEPFLNYMGDMRIDMWFITHMDKDHYSGLAGMIERSCINKISIGTLVLPDITDKEEFTELLKYRDCFEKICFIRAGSVINAGKVTFSCLNPKRETEHYKNANDYSLVLNLIYNDFNMLFTGDISSETEREILENVPECDVLKVAHHGSEYSSCSEFLDKTKAKIALISAGEDNSYGHPDKKVLERLRQRNTDIFVTMDSGAVMLSTDGKRIRSSTYKTNEKKP